MNKIECYAHPDATPDHTSHLCNIKKKLYCANCPTAIAFLKYRRDPYDRTYGSEVVKMETDGRYAHLLTVNRQEVIRVALGKIYFKPTP